LTVLAIRGTVQRAKVRKSSGFGGFRGDDRHHLIVIRARMDLSSALFHDSWGIGQGRHMAGFHTHITVSTAVGVGYAFVGSYVFHLPLSTCAIGGGLCGISGIMPDLDSDHAVPARETLSFLAAVAPMLLFYRFHFEGMATEHMLLLGAPLYLLIRFGFGQMLKTSVHRGMFHSIPAAVIAGLIAYVLCDTGISTGRSFKAIGATIGYLTHLFLDELWAIEFAGAHIRLKKSFGTAMKLFGQSGPANSATWALLAGLSLFSYNDQGHPEIAAPFQRTRADLLQSVPPSRPSSDDGRVRQMARIPRRTREMPLSDTDDSRHARSEDGDWR
jgi:membrane-bound metal-dependent hydrolase YbcI (DUF457 family)